MRLSLGGRAFRLLASIVVTEMLVALVALPMLRSRSSGSRHTGGGTVAAIAGPTDDDVVPPGEDVTPPTTLAPGPDAAAGAATAGVAGVPSQPKAKPRSTATTQAPAAAAVAVVPQGVFAAPNGSAKNPGSVSAPLDLATALGKSSPVKPGQTLWLRGGTYGGRFTSEIQGTPSAPITVKPYPGEHAVIDGGTQSGTVLLINGGNVWWWDLEVMKSDPARTSSQSGSNPTDISRGRGNGIDVYGPGTRLIDDVVHDAGNGIGLWGQAGDLIADGVIAYNNGWVGTDRAHGHGIYVQNQLPTHKQLINALVFNNYAEGIHGYSQAGWVQGITIDGTTSFGNGSPGLPQSDLHRVANLLLGGTDNPSDDISVTNSSFYQSPGTAGGGVGLGYQAPNSGRVSFIGNIIGGGGSGLGMFGWAAATISNNIIQVALPKVQGAGQTITGVQSPQNAHPPYQWDGNHYFDTPEVSAPLSFKFNGTTVNSSQFLSYADWRAASGFDSTTSYARGLPSGVNVSVRPSQYEPGRALVTVFNWASAPSVAVDLSRSGLQVGQRFAVRDVQALGAGPLLEGVYNGGPVAVPLTGTSVTAPIGAQAPAHTGRDFGAFLVTAE